MRRWWWLRLNPHPRPPGQKLFYLSPRSGERSAQSAGWGADAFGNALGNSIVGAARRYEENTAKYVRALDEAVAQGKLSPSDAARMKAGEVSLLAKWVGDNSSDVKTVIGLPEAPKEGEDRFAALRELYDPATGEIREGKHEEFFKLVKERELDLTVSVQGINTGPSGYDDAQNIAAINNDVVVGVINPTEGFVRDIVQSALQIFTGFEDPLSVQVRTEITNALRYDSDGHVTVVGHSQGTIVTINVLSRLSDEQRANIDYVSVATATPWAPSGLNSYRGFINPADVVPWVTSGLATARVDLYSWLFDSYKNYDVTLTSFWKGGISPDFANHSFTNYLKESDVIRALKVPGG